MSGRSGNQRYSAASTVAMVFVVAVVVNLPWELAQIGVGLFANITCEMVFCLTCSLGDGLLVLLILAVGRLVFGTLEWFVRPGTRGYVLMLGVGAALAITVELAALNAGRWQYEPAMPLLPVARVGLFPVLQMMLLPVIIFRVVAAVRARRISERR